LDIGSLAKQIEAYIPPKYIAPVRPDVVPSVGKCELTVRTLRGKTLVLNVDYSDTVRFIKAKVAEAEGYPPEKLTLCFGQRQELVPLDESKALRQCEVFSGANIFVRRAQHAAWGAYAPHWESVPVYFSREGPDPYVDISRIRDK